MQQNSCLLALAAADPTWPQTQMALLPIKSKESIICDDNIEMIDEDVMI
jgi:hypothetical protein